MPTVTRFLYRVLGIGGSALGGVLAGAVFKQPCRTVAREENAPKAADRSRGRGEVISAAALEGAVFGIVKAAVDRAGAIGLARAKGK